MLDEVIFSTLKITLDISISRRRQIWQTVSFYRSSQNSDVLVFIAARDDLIYTWRISFEYESYSRHFYLKKKTNLTNDVILL